MYCTSHTSAEVVCQRTDNRAQTGHAHLSPAHTPNKDQKQLSAASWYAERHVNGTKQNSFIVGDPVEEKYDFGSLELGNSIDLRRSRE